MVLCTNTISTATVVLQNPIPHPFGHVPIPHLGEEVSPVKKDFFLSLLNGFHLVLVTWFYC